MANFVVLEWSFQESIKLFQYSDNKHHWQFVRVTSRFSVNSIPNLCNSELEIPRFWIAENLNDIQIPAENKRNRRDFINR